MKAFILATVMMLGLSAGAAPVKQMGQLTQGEFDFQVTSPRPGLVTFGDFRAAAGFPFLRGGTVSTVRWYYSTESFDMITPESEFIEQWLDPRDYSIPVLGIGNLMRGMRYYFKVGLATRDGMMIYFTNDYETDVLRHSVVVQ